MKRSHYLALATLFAGGWIAAWGLGRHAAPGEQGPAAAALEAVESPLRLEAEVERRDRQIADLRAEVRLLEGRLAALASERSEVSDGPKPEGATTVAAQEEPNTELADRPFDLARLRELLPDKYARLSAEELAMLTELDLRGEEVTDADLQALAELTHLRDLSLRGTQITDAGLVHLGPQLENLVLRGTGVSGLGLSNLYTPGLEALHLCDTHVTGADLHRLPPMPSLKTLKLNFLDLDDSSVDSIGSYPSLRHVELDQTAITDHGLRRLLTLNPKLERIELRSTQVTQEGAQAISEEFPGCQLVFDNGQIWTAHK